MCIGSSSAPAISSATSSSTLLGAQSIGAPQSGPRPTARARPPTILGGGSSTSTAGNVSHTEGFGKPGRQSSL